ncbi:hypothetical protein A2U01_0079911, partial [Trifolium medium]|nr:hypothetical protein [Trifolium medium]
MIGEGGIGCPDVCMVWCERLGNVCGVVTRVCDMRIDDVDASFLLGKE